MNCDVGDSSVVLCELPHRILLFGCFVPTLLLDKVDFTPIFQFIRKCDLSVTVSTRTDHLLVIPGTSARSDAFNDKYLPSGVIVSTSIERRH